MSNNNSFNGTITYFPIEVQILSIELNYVLKMYVIRIISGLDILFNVFTMVICVNKQLTNQFYTYLWCRGLINGTVCLFGLAFLQMS